MHLFKLYYVDFSDATIIMVNKDFQYISSFLYLIIIIIIIIVIIIIIITMVHQLEAAGMRIKR